MNLQALETLTHYAHSQKVAQISGILARHAGFSPKEAEIIEQAAALHDIGKNSVPESILLKPGKLTPEEFEIIKTHTTLGARQISDTAQVLTVADSMAKYHHERLDGKGYPCGLSGNEIPAAARLVAVVDVAEALLSKRSYKSCWNIHDVVEYMRQNAGTQFDAEYVELLIALTDTITAMYHK
ncbi:hypothetical protein FACS1894191_7490 [Clostridia bacterium]|nr:hypothetical protein FACS1894191_7490 [Clostridia bacterium]